MKMWYIVMLFYSFAGIAYSQTTIKGTVYDSISNEPLPFVNVFNTRLKRYETSGIDGRFSIEARVGDVLELSYVGYKTVRTVVDDMQEMRVGMTLAVRELQVVEVTAGENPAFPIVRKAIANKVRNDPENLRSFSYKAYHKFYATTEGVFDSAALKKRGGKFLSTHHIFINETLSERKVLKPNRDEEIVVANRMSGVKDPFFAILATNFQPFTFYQDHITLFDKNYLNPVAPGTFDRYEFELEDTLSHPADTTFVISFQPKPGKTFEALKGVLYINTDGYAIEHVLAEPHDPKSLVQIKIQQKYERVSGTWFPSQLNTEFILKEYQILNHPVKYVHRSFLSEQQINPPLNKKQFGTLNLSFTADANKQDDSAWKRLRFDSLTFKESNTYRFYDSIPARRLVALNKVVKIGESLAAGKFQYKNLYLPIRHWLRINEYEDYRFGFGIETSEAISKWFSLDGYAGYGVKDKALKYEGGIRFFLSHRSDVSLRMSYARDVEEPGSSVFIAPPSALSSNERRRNWLASRMDSVQRIKAELQMRPFPFVKAIVFTAFEQRNPTYDFQYVLEDGRTTNAFEVQETGLLFRFSAGEHYTQIRNTRVVTSYKYPQINFRASHFADRATLLSSFFKAELKIDHQFLLRGIGKTKVEVHAGLIDGQAPYPYLFNGKGVSSGSFKSNLLIPNYFQTMGLYEFVSNRFVNLFLSQHLGRLVSTRFEYFRPELSLVQHAGIGSISGDERQLDVSVRSYPKGFLECGIVLDNIVRFRYVDMAYIGVGAGTFYRYGPYQHPDIKDNFSVCVNVNFTF